MKTLIKQIIKFGIVGILAFIIDYGILLFLTETLHIHYLFSSALSYIIALIFNYVCSIRFVFNSKKNLNKQKEFLIFCILSFIGLGINQLIMWFMVEKIHIFYAITKIIATVIVMIWNFISRKFFLEEH